MDREKVISGFQRCRLMNKMNCDKCPYDYNGRGNGKSECTAELATDALALLKEQERTINGLQNAYGYLQKQFFEAQDKLLKEQEAVVPYQHDAVWLCGNCEKEVVGWNDDIDGKEYRYPFCRQCGQAVKWE